MGENGWSLDPITAPGTEWGAGVRRREVKRALGGGDTATREAWGEERIRTSPRETPDRDCPRSSQPPRQSLQDRVSAPPTRRSAFRGDPRSPSFSGEWTAAGPDVLCSALGLCGSWNVFLLAPEPSARPEG